jgi:hypothetical protein
MTVELRYSDSYQHVAYVGSKRIGRFLMDESGYFGYWPDESLTGYWSSHAIRLVADKLDELNKDWDTHVAQALGSLADLEELDTI